MKKVYVLSLGCPRNLVDAEVLSGKLKEKGFFISESAEGSEAAIINTCGFIDDAKKESIDHILSLVELKKAGKIKRLIVMGCLSQRYPVELINEIKEIDAIFGTSDFTRIPEDMERIMSGASVSRVASEPRYLYDHTEYREILTLPHSVYVKIQEGCSNRCSYCVIPELKGPRRSRQVSSVVRELGDLRKRYAVKEAVLIGQDTTSFGVDRAGKSELDYLLKQVSPLMAGGWVRLLYTHPAHFTDDLIKTISNTDNICKYVDIPIQHINDDILKSMNRRVSKKDIKGLIRRIRDNIGGVVLRTSIIVGFPGESEDAFLELMDFLEESRFDRLGAFTYSQEDGTPAGAMADQISEQVKTGRFDRVMSLQQRISRENNQKLLNSTQKVLIDECVEADPDQFIGRSYMDAPEVDGVVYVRGKGLEVGEFRDVLITGTMEYDLIGEAV
jgi:ribosomal protein S12 methylthiotransferase